MRFGEGAGHVSIEGDGGVCSVAAIGSVWWRVKPVGMPEPSARPEYIGQLFASGEWRHVIHSLALLLDDLPWTNTPEATFRAAYKPFQLALAERVGLEIPLTVITNDPAAVDPLFEGCHRVVYKTLQNFVFPPDEYIFTTEVKRQNLHADVNRVRRAPGIYQALLDKAYELRVTVVGEDVFVARIDSQGRDTSALDWRRDQLADMYTEAELPAGVLSAMLRFHRHAGLSYGAYDFVVTTEGRYVFLECNPSGQWLWLEEALGLPISRALATLLMTSQHEPSQVNRSTQPQSRPF